MKNLHHNQKITINGNRGTVGTSFSYLAESYDAIETVVELLNREKNPLMGPDPDAWVSKECACICSDKSYYKRQEEIWANAVEIKDEEIVAIDGKFWRTKYMGEFSDMVHFIAIEN